MRLGIATYRDLPDPTPDDALMVEALVGVEVVARSWDDPGAPWASCDGVFVRSPWDYHTRVEEFVSWVRALEASGTPVWNPAALIEWNARKTYLRDLAAAGVPIVPTLWLEPSDINGWPAAIRDAGWDDLVLKPMVGASSFLTWRASRDEAIARTDRLERLALQGGALAQPFVPEVLTEGEWSLMYFEGVFSHAVRKRAKVGEFRVQVEFGGSEVAEEPPAEVVESGLATLATLPAPPLYARVDGVAGTSGFVLTELELIEPVLFLGSSADAPARLARAVVARLEESSGRAAAEAQERLLRRS